MTQPFFTNKHEPRGKKKRRDMKYCNILQCMYSLSSDLAPDTFASLNSHRSSSHSSRRRAHIISTKQNVPSSASHDKITSAYLTHTPHKLRNPSKQTTHHMHQMCRTILYKSRTCKHR